MEGLCQAGLRTTFPCLRVCVPTEKSEADARNSNAGGMRTATTPHPKKVAADTKATPEVAVSTATSLNMTHVSWRETAPRAAARRRDSKSAELKDSVQTASSPSLPLLPTFWAYISTESGAGFF